MQTVEESAKNQIKHFHQQCCQCNPSSEHVHSSQSVYPGNIWLQKDRTRPQTLVGIQHSHTLSENIKKYDFNSQIFSLFLLLFVSQHAYSSKKNLICGNWVLWFTIIEIWKNRQVKYEKSWSIVWYLHSSFKYQLKVI